MNTEIINQIIEMLKAGASYSEIQNKLNVYPVQIKRIKDKYVSTNSKNSDNNDSTNDKNNNTNVSVNKEKELELKLQQIKIELATLKEHNYELQAERLKMRQELEQVKQETIELATLKEHNYELQAENLKMQRELEQIKKENENNKEIEPDEPKLEDAVYWKNKNVEGGIVSIKLGDNENEPNIAEVEFDNEEVIEIPFNKLIDDNGERWLFENEIKTHHQRMLEFERKRRERKREHEEFLSQLKRL